MGGKRSRRPEFEAVCRDIGVTMMKIFALAARGGAPSAYRATGETETAEFRAEVMAGLMTCRIGTGEASRAERRRCGA
jgi:hypothetical protein